MIMVAHQGCRPIVLRRKMLKGRMIRVYPRGFIRKITAISDALMKRRRRKPARSGMNPSGNGSRGLRVVPIKSIPPRLGQFRDL